MAVDRPRRLVSRSPDATRALGAALGRVLPYGTLVALDGELGSGKTCFVQGLAEGLGVVDLVTSPTYALLQSYEGRMALHHFDAYMEGRERALLQDGGLECIHEGGVAVVEWAARVADVLPTPRLAIRLEHRGPEARRLSIHVEDPAAPDPRLRAIVRDLALPPGVETEIEECP